MKQVPRPATSATFIGARSFKHLVSVDKVNDFFFIFTKLQFTTIDQETPSSLCKFMKTTDIFQHGFIVGHCCFDLNRQQNPAALVQKVYFITIAIPVEIKVALNKSDLLSKKQILVNREELSARLGCPVVKTDSIKGSGLSELIIKAANLFGQKQTAPFKSEKVKLQDPAAVEKADWERFTFIEDLVRAVETRMVASHKQTRQDAVDRIVANKILGIRMHVLSTPLPSHTATAAPKSWQQPRPLLMILFVSASCTKFTFMIT